MHDTTPIPRAVATRARRALTLLGMLAMTGAAAGGEATRVTVLPVEFLKADYFPDHEVVSAEEQARLEMVAAMIRDRLRQEDYAVSSRDQTVTAVTAVDAGSRLHECNGCERDIARALDADWVLVSWIQMVSNLIVNLNVVAYDVSTGARVAQAFVDLRGNNERSWRRATRYLLDRILVTRMNDARRSRVR